MLIHCCEKVQFYNLGINVITSEAMREKTQGMMMVNGNIYYAKSKQLKK